MVRVGLQEAACHHGITMCNQKISKDPRRKKTITPRKSKTAVTSAMTVSRAETTKNMHILKKNGVMTSKLEEVPICLYAQRQAMLHKRPAHT